MHTRPDHLNAIARRTAQRAGWQEDVPSGFWYAVEESMPAATGQANPADFVMNLDGIQFGSIALSVSLGKQATTLVIDDCDDSILLLARFVRVLRRGGHPHAALADQTHSHVFVGPGPDPQLVRLLLVLEPNDRCDEWQLCEGLVDRQTLVEAFSRLALEISYHPNFGHHFVLHASLNGDAYDRVADEADDDFGRLDGEEDAVECWNAREQFVAAQIAGHLALSEREESKVKQYRSALRRAAQGFVY